MDMDGLISKEFLSDEFHQYYFWLLILLLIIAIILFGVILWYIRRCRRIPRCEYTVLGDESLHDRMEMDKKLFKDSDRNMSMIRCQYYLRDSSRYIFLSHLPNMGNRIDKNWFLVRDSATKTERLLTMTPMTEKCPFKYNIESRQKLLDLFLALQHPYIYPVLDIDRKIVMEQEYIIVIMPFNEEGSLKDFIHQSHCQRDYKQKYHFSSSRMGADQLQRLGCQVLEALLFLKDQGFPPFLHLHSGNVILQNGVARISGLENTLFGYSSHMHLMIPKRLRENKEAAESICFGHLLFEMASGYELTTSSPSDKNYQDLENLPKIIEVLKFIFEQGRYQYPTLKEIASLEFFRHIDLRELQSVMPSPIIKGRLNASSRALLKEIKRHLRPKRSSKRSSPQSHLGEELRDIESQSSIFSERL